MTTTWYATPTGQRYHSTPACTGLNAWCLNAGGWDAMPPTVTRSEIIARDLQPCLACCPPPILRVMS